MKKISNLLFLMFLVFLVFSSAASAHTGLETSYPSEGQTVKDELKEITLDFETKIEKGSIFNLISEDGKEVSLENIQVGDNRLSANTIETLKNGNYTVNWKIVGADGHPIEGQFKFVVSVAEKKEVETNESINSTEENSNESPSTENKETGDTSAVSEELDESNQSNIIIPIVIGILLLIAIGTTILLLRKKR